MLILSSGLSENNCGAAVTVVESVSLVVGVVSVLILSSELSENICGFDVTVVESA